MRDLKKILTGSVRIICQLRGEKLKKVKRKFFFVWELHVPFRREVFLLFSAVNRPRKGVDRCHQSAVCRGIFEATLEPPPPSNGGD